MLLALSSILILSLAAPLAGRLRPLMAGWVCALVPLGLTVYFLGQVGRVTGEQAIVESYTWIPTLGVTLSFYLDGLSLFFALLITGVGALIMVYSGAYMAEDPHLGRFFRFMSEFMGAMLGMVLAGNLITLFVFWELTSITSFLLIGFHHQEKKSGAAALQALLVTALGGQALLAGFLLLGHIGGTLELAELLGQGETIRRHGLYLPIFLLILAGAFTKSAQMPFHFWLPSAMAAPTPVSAYLHSVTMVKAGIYLLARLSPVLGDTAFWHGFLISAGGTTMLLGAIMALWQTDFKRLLAYSTINALGILIFLLGIDTETAVKAALVFLLVHALYKGALFMVAGAVDHETGTRDIRRLSGLARRMPLIAAAAVLAALSMAGVPPFLGFIGKETIYHAVLEAPFAGALLTVMAVAANIFLVALAGIIIIRPFFGRAEEKPHPHPASTAFNLGPILFAGGSLLIALLPKLVQEKLLTPAAASVLAHPTHVKLELWHGINPRLVLSLITLAAGTALYAGRHRLWSALGGGRRLAAWGPDRWYEWTLAGLNGFAAAQTRWLQSGRLQNYILIVLLATFGLTAFSLATHGGVSFPAQMLSVRVSDAAVAVLIMAATFLALFSRSRLGAIVAIGGVGFGIALLYARFNAPDLAMTQFAVETVTVILFVLVLHRLPAYPGPPERLSKARDALIAIGAGAMVTVLMLSALGTGEGSRVAAFFAEKSVPEAHGRNIVNVILVDFRALDTLGEITVMVLAALGVHGLLKLRPGRRRNK